MPLDFGTNLVLVTGATGWLGMGLVDALINGLPQNECLPSPRPELRVRCLVLPGQRYDRLERIDERVEVVMGDVRSLGDCSRFCGGARGAILFHTAGTIHPDRVREFYQVNVNGTRNVLEAAASAGVRRAVIISSNSPCGCNPTRDHRFDEDSPYNPYMNYGRSKMLMEQAVGEAQAVGRLEAVVIRAPWFYGPHQPPRQSLFFHMIRDGRIPVVGDGNNLRSMAYIDNLAQGILLAAVTPRAAGQTYWIADERPYSMNEVVDVVERLLETEFGIRCAHKRLRLPGAVGGVAWFVDKALQALGLYHQKIHVLSEMNKTIACSIARAKRELGYRPTVELEEGMRRSLKWLKAQGGLS